MLTFYRLVNIMKNVFQLCQDINGVSEVIITLLHTENAMNS